MIVLGFSDLDSASQFPYSPRACGWRRDASALWPETWKYSRNLICSEQQRTEETVRASRQDFCHYLPDRFIWSICNQVSRVAEDIFCVPFAMIKLNGVSLQMTRNRNTSFGQDLYNTFSRRLPNDLNKNIAVSCSPLAQRNFASSIFHDHETPRPSPSSRVCIAAMSLCSCRIRNKAFSATYGILMSLNIIKTKSIIFSILKTSPWQERAGIFVFTIHVRRRHPN